ncbi:hypothetical protein [Roseateles saccharophilus]|nr:hypothetical protein [Roseateles saccharophilus]MDG0834253.1 hypothetical protein [Roseateles saccharophilus]
MQFFDASQFPWSNSKLPQNMALTLGSAQRLAGSTGSRKIDCSWYDSSFDLAQGLEVAEHDNDTLYQLWELSRN